MLGNLLKYDLKNMFKTLIPTYLILMMLSILNRLGEFATSHLSILKIPAGFITVAYIIVIIAIPFIAFIISIVRFYRNLAKDEGYLMHTLPVKKDSLVLSKLLSAGITMIISVIVSILGIFLGGYGIYFHSDIFQAIKNIWLQIVNYTDVLLITLMILSVIISPILQQLMIYASIALGQKHNGNKLVYAFVYGIVIYNIVQVVSSVIILLPMILNPNWFVYLNSETPPLYVLNTVLGLSVIISIAISVVFYFITTKTMEKKLNLD